MLLFPQTQKDYNLFISSDYSAIKTIIDDKVPNFFEEYEKIKQIKNQDNSKQIICPSSLNQILKKIICEKNKIKSAPNKINQNLILLISDGKENDKFFYDQQLLYLLKKYNVNFDCIHLGENNNEYNSKFESISFYCDGIFENVEVDKEEYNLTQILLQEFLPLPYGKKINNRNIQKVNDKNDKIYCDECGGATLKRTYYPNINMILCDECARRRSIP